MAEKKTGRKGGTRFPNYSLKQVLLNLKDLISKTHTKSITIEQLNAGVFNVEAASASGKVRYSSLKQYGLANGEYKSINASDLASKIVHSTGDEKIQFIRQAFFNVSTFKNIFETYQDSSVSQDRIKGYVSSTLKVHPDLSEKFLESFLESAEEAKLCSLKGDEITFIDGKDIQFNDESETDNKGDEQANQIDFSDRDKSANNASKESPVENNKNFGQTQKRITNNAPTIELKIDPTLDAEKLEKQLEVLRKYGLV